MSGWGNRKPGAQEEMLKQTSNKWFMKIDFDSVMVILQIVIIIWWNVNFDGFHGAPGRRCYFPGAGVNVSVKTHLKGQLSFISQLRFCCLVLHLWLQGCLNAGVITHTSGGDGAWSEATLLSSHSHTSSCHWWIFSLKQHFSHSRPGLLEKVVEVFSQQGALCFSSLRDIL